MSLILGVMLVGLAQEQGGEAAAPAPKPVKEKKICRAGMSVNSRLTPPKVCRTSAEWARIDGTPARDADVARTVGALN